MDQLHVAVLKLLDRLKVEAGSSPEIREGAERLLSQLEERQVAGEKLNQQLAELVDAATRLIGLDIESLSKTASAAESYHALVIGERDRVVRDVILPRALVVCQTIWKGGQGLIMKLGEVEAFLTDSFQDLGIPVQRYIASNPSIRDTYAKFVIGTIPGRAIVVYLVVKTNGEPCVFYRKFNWSDRGLVQFLPDNIPE